MTKETEQKCRDCAQDILDAVLPRELQNKNDQTYAAAKIAALVAEAVSECEAQLAKDPRTAQVELLVDENHDLKTVIAAWQSAFGTTQLTHAIARLESAEKERDRLRIALDRAHQNENRLALLDWIKTNVGNIDFHVKIPAGVISTNPWIAVGDNFEGAISKAKEQLSKAVNRK